MNLLFERVLESDEARIAEIYNIIKICGEDMSDTQDLHHWENPYQTESIKKHCTEREVFVVKDLELDKYVHTFQLEFLEFPQSQQKDPAQETNYVAEINKFATIPEVAGRGVGKASMEYIEDYCRSRNVFKIILDVYDKNEHAIKFYQKRGFTIIGSKPTRRFSVYMMEKLL
jgi:GNAT superfamily N-acetyltransferase